MFVSYASFVGLLGIWKPDQCVWLLTDTLLGSSFLPYSLHLLARYILWLTDMYEWLYIVELSWFCDDLEKKQEIVHIGWEFHFLALYHEYNIWYTLCLWTQYKVSQVLALRSNVIKCQELIKESKDMVTASIWFNLTMRSICLICVICIDDLNPQNNNLIKQKSFSTLIKYSSCHRFMVVRMLI